jgi:hypothetical protein
MPESEGDLVRRVALAAAAVAASAITVGGAAAAHASAADVADVAVVAQQDSALAAALSQVTAENGAAGPFGTFNR